MFSTGPMALSAEHLRFVAPPIPSPPSSSSSPNHTFSLPSSPLRVLDGPEHHLSGRVSTPLFNHLGASSWHRDDAKTLQWLVRYKGTIALLLLLGGIVLVGITRVVGGGRKRGLGVVARWRRGRGGYESVGGTVENGRFENGQGEEEYFFECQVDEEAQEMEEEMENGWTTRSDRLANHNSRKKTGPTTGGGGQGWFKGPGGMFGPLKTPLSATFGLIRLSSYSSIASSESDSSYGGVDKELGSGGVEGERLDYDLRRTAPLPSPSGPLPPSSPYLFSPTPSPSLVPRYDTPTTMVPSPSPSPSPTPTPSPFPSPSHSRVSSGSLLSAFNGFGIARSSSPAPGAGLEDAGKRLD